MRGGRDDSSMARYPSSFSRHTSPHPIRRTPASEASGGAPTEVDVTQLGRDSARVRGPRETAARAPAHLAKRRLLDRPDYSVDGFPEMTEHGALLTPTPQRQLRRHLKPTN